MLTVHGALALFVQLGGVAWEAGQPELLGRLGHGVLEELDLVLGVALLVLLAALQHDERGDGGDGCGLGETHDCGDYY